MPRRSAPPVDPWKAAPATAASVEIIDAVAAGTGPGEDDGTHPAIRALHWWFTVLLHSLIVVAVVLGTVYLARLAL